VPARRPEGAQFFTEMVKVVAGLFVAGMGAIGFLARPDPLLESFEPWRTAMIIGAIAFTALAVVAGVLLVVGALRALREVPK
jgi:hypothetical protein